MGILSFLKIILLSRVDRRTAHAETVVSNFLIMVRDRPANMAELCFPRTARQTLAIHELSMNGIHQKSRSLLAIN